jgi:hypothetical protein
MVRDQLVIKSTGEVEMDGKKLGWISNVSFEPIYTYRISDHNDAAEEYRIRLDIVVLPQRPEPHGAYDFAGNLIGHMDSHGKMIPC